MTKTATSRRVLLVLVSWAPDAPAGIERATAALALGLAQSGHRPVIATAAPQPDIDSELLPGVTVDHLTIEGLTFPCDDQALRRAVTLQDGLLSAQIRAMVLRHRIDTVLFTDALWGLGRLRGEIPGHVRRALAVHVPPHIVDAGPAVARATRILFPSSTIQQHAIDWAVLGQVVPNALMSDPAAGPAPDAARREVLRRTAPIRVLARLGPEKGVAELLEALPAFDRTVEIALASAGFEDHDGSQRHLLDRCRHLADHCPNVSLRSALPWSDVPNWLAGAAAVIVPSHKETFGLVALEAMSVGTPIIAYRVGNLPDLIEPTGHGEHLLTDHDSGPHGLLKTATALLDDAILYGATTQAVYRRAGDFAPHRIAELFIEAVS
ncbi:glycosyltransferase family 4 protein [Kitasatospora sp. NPDC002227]|uniref:glycosyltransferase family 4 protein n=1 Tax=Kitasatospora sp. NPDC002227 TaxID=3154773 RepID=UPI00332334C0